MYSSMLQTTIALLMVTLNGFMASPLAERGLSTWPDRILAPYLYTSKWNTFDIDNAFQKTGHSTWTLCFLIADKWGNPSWNADSTLDDDFYSEYIKKIRALGGDVIVSFGGAAGVELAVAETDVNKLVNKYQAVIDKYALTYIDIDIEGSAVGNKQSVDRRSQALKIIKERNQNLILSYTVATTPNGLPNDVLYLINSAKNYGLKLDVVNIMAMDYGNVSNGWSGMGGYAISASEGLRKQLVAAGMSDCKVGVTPMIGQNDVASEVFQLSDAKELSDWAKNKDWVRTLAFWSINRDNSKKGDLFISTKVDQKDFEFLTNLQEWSKGGKPIYTNPAPVLPDLTKIPDRIFAPYVDILTHPTFDINFASSKSGVSQFILGSMGSNQFGNPAWGDNLALDEQFYVDYIKKIRANGGDIMISFGGPETKELALGKKDPKELQKKYQWVIDQYALRWMDFNMQDDAINDLASIDVRSKALYGLTQQNGGLILQMTLPVTSNGLTDAGIKLLKNAVDNGLQFNVVNLFAMDLPNMGGDTITATNLAYNQILATGMKNFKLGITVMIGQNNITKSVFTEKDAADLVNYSKENSNILLLSIWSMNRDNPLNGPLFESTQIKQGDFAFSNTFNTWVTNKPKIEITTVEVPHIVTPSAPAPVIPDPVPIKVDEIKKITGFPAKVFAPFCDVNLWPTFDVTKTMDKTGTNWYTLAFITADWSGNPAWGSSVKLDDRFYGDTIDYLRSKGGDIIITFGGASGQELALMTTDVGLLQKKYQRVIDMYAPRWVDFDIEGGAILDNNSVIRRSQAVAGLVAANPGLRTSVTLPASPSGLLSEGVELLKTAAKNGWAIDVVNIMAMDYGGGQGKMGDFAISAAKATYQQSIDAGLKNFKIGVTPMIGNNNVAGEVFTLSNTQQLVDFAKTTPWIGWMAYWSINRDTDVNGPLYASSQVKQDKYAFANLFQSWANSGSTEIPQIAPEELPHSTEAVPVSYPLGLDKKIFAPFCDVMLWPTFDVSALMSSLNTPWFTLAFILADGNGEPTWGGITPMKSNFYSEQLTKLRALGGDAIVSFGGAIGPELATVVKDPVELQKKYQIVIDQYQLKWVDFDIEGSAIADSAANDRRSIAFAGLRKANPNLIISVTLPAMPDGLDQYSIALINSDIKQGGNINVVNIMAMDYGSGQGKMGIFAISAAENTYKQVKAAGLPNVKIGITPMIGQNDIEGEIFTLDDANSLYAFTQQTDWVTWIGYWSINRDTNNDGPLYSSTQISQEKFAFAKIFAKLVKAPIDNPIDPKIPELNLPDSFNLGGYTWSHIIFAPYLDVSTKTFDMVDITNTIGSTRYIIGYITANKDGKPAWGGKSKISTLFYLDQIQRIRKSKGDVIIGIGGPGKTLAIKAKNVLELQNNYQNIIDAYDVNWIDIKLEADALDKNSIDRRNEALAGIQKFNPNIRISYTLPAALTGLDKDSLYIAESALNYGVAISEINIIPDSSLKASYAKGVINSAYTTNQQILKLGLQTKIGILLDLDVIDVNDISKLVEGAKKVKWIGLLSYFGGGKNDSEFGKSLAHYEH